MPLTSKEPGPAHSDLSSTKSVLAFVLPLVLFMAIGALESNIAPTDGIPGNVQAEGNLDSQAEVDRQKIFSLSNRYGFFVTARLVIVVSVLAFFWPTYVRHFPLRLSPWSIAVGVVGVVVWIGICELQIERQLISMLGLSSGWIADRTGFPATADNLPGWNLFGFLVSRFGLLVVAVPLAEELLLRGFLVRYLQDYDWGNVSFGKLSWVPLAAASVYGALTHPGEMFAAIAWFSMITVLMVRTRNFWDCVVAHAVTNLLLGIYVVGFAQWHYW